MKKKILSILTLVIVAVLVLGASASAYTPPPEGEGDIVITASEIDIDGDMLIGEEVTFSGTVTVDVSCTSEQWFMWYESAGAFAEAGYSVNGVSYSVDDLDEVIDALQGATATATVDLDWTQTCVFDTVGDYNVSQYGFGAWYILHEFGYWDIGDGDEDYQSFVRSFHIDRTYPELYFRVSGMYVHGSASYRDGSTTPQPILNAVNAIGRSNGGMYRVYVPTGTVITDLRGEKALCFHILDIVGNTLTSSFRSMEFSNPVTVYYVDEVYQMDELGVYPDDIPWEPILTFSGIDENGIAY